jgi:hypothetical protein
MRAISENTNIKLGAAILAIGGAAFWVASRSKDVEAQGRRQDAVEVRQDHAEARQEALIKEVTDLKVIVSHIDGQVNLLVEQQRKGN